MFLQVVLARALELQPAVRRAFGDELAPEAGERDAAA